MTLKTSAVSIFAYVHPPTPLQTHWKTSEVRGPNFTKCLQNVRASSGWKSIIRFASFPTFVECQRTKWRRDVSIFADTSH